MRRIFISHSTDKSDVDGRAYLNTLVSGLADARDEHGQLRFEIFYDRKSLEGGDDWNLKIVNHLIYCHAAVLVLSPRALESDFVKFEVSNLMARRARQRDPQTHQPLFDVVPVLPWIDGAAVSPQAFEKEMLAKLDLGFWKAIGFGAGINYSGPSEAATIVPALIAKLSGVDVDSQDAAIARIERDIATYLERVKRALLDAAAVAAGFSAPPPGVTDEEAAMHVTRGLLLSPLDLVFKALQEMKASLKRDVVDVFDLLAPCWVSPEAARLLTAPLERKPPGSCAILNGALVSFTPESVRPARSRHESKGRGQGDADPRARHRRERSRRAAAQGPRAASGYGAGTGGCQRPGLRRDVEDTAPDSFEGGASRGRGAVVERGDADAAARVEPPGRVRLHPVHRPVGRGGVRDP